MAQPTQFDQALEVVEHLSDEEQADLVDVIERRLAERGRERVANEVEQARRDFADGKCPEATVDEIMREIES